jgi:hypothetical protein
MKKFDDDSREMKLAKELYWRIIQLDRKVKEPAWQKWASEFDKLMRIDERDYDQIMSLIKWVFTQSTFWPSNILSPAKLRLQYSKILIQSGLNKVSRPAPSLPAYKEYVRPEERRSSPGSVGNYLADLKGLANGKIKKR